MIRDRWRGVTRARLGRVRGYVAALLALLLVGAACLALVTLSMQR